jgi:valyl-tRNA synthetase
VGTTSLGTFWIGADGAAAQAAGARATARQAELREQVDRLRALVSNEAFIARAPAAVVERERARLGELESQLAAVGEDAG